MRMSSYSFCPYPTLGEVGATCIFLPFSPISHHLHNSQLFHLYYLSHSPYIFSLAFVSSYVPPHLCLILSSWQNILPSSSITSSLSSLELLSNFSWCFTLSFLVTPYIHLNWCECKKWKEVCQECNEWRLVLFTYLSKRYCNNHDS